MWQTIQDIFPYAIAYTIPLLIVALGGLYSERSGVVNIGLDGLMIIGSFAGVITVYLLPKNIPGALWIGLIVAALAGMAFSLLHAIASINLKANQVISGTAINLMAGSLTIYLCNVITGGSGRLSMVKGLPRKDIPFLSEIPVIGPLFFTNVYATTWVVLIILILSTLLLYKTKFGLRLRACGENPQAVAAAGVSVTKMRYFGVLASGALAGLGGAIMSMTYYGEFNGSVSGLGFLALAALIFGQWKPIGILGASIFFGLATTIANVSQVIQSFQKVPPMYLKMFPYVVTLIALVLFSKKTQAPKASGEPFDAGKR